MYLGGEIFAHIFDKRGSNDKQNEDAWDDALATSLCWSLGVGSISNADTILVYYAELIILPSVPPFPPSILYWISLDN